MTRAKENLRVRVTKRLPAHADRRILRDDLVVLRGVRTKDDYPVVLRRVTAKVLVDGLSAEIASLHDRFETNSIQELAPGERVYEGRFDTAMSKNLPHQAKHHRGRGQSPGRGIGR